ncbi:shikimate kinase [Flavobacterium sp. Sd200]|nr:shikimate kinase [Flavobacterium sp. Sd200]
MASGKSTIARLLSQSAQIPYLDLDEVIEKETQKTVADIFAQDGEIKFRKLEHNALKGLIAVDEPFVLALGGGTPCYANNHLLMQDEGVVSVYLKTSIDEIVSRLQGQTSARPLVANLNTEELHEFVAKHLFDRSWFYHQAKHIVSTDGKTPEMVVNEIMSLF